MRICCIGWSGPDYDEALSGVLAIDPNALFIEIGSGTSCSEARFYGTNKNRVISGDWEQAAGLSAGYDVVIYSTYWFSRGHRGEIHSHSLQDNDMVHSYAFTCMKQFKILFDGESVAGEENFKFYISIARQFNAVITYNPVMKAWCDRSNIPCHLDVVGVSPLFCNPTPMFRDIDVLYSGSNLEKLYRGELTAALRKKDGVRNQVIFGSVELRRYIDFLRRSKIVLCTLSCASGEKYPQHIKHKEYKALLCGAVPLRERSDTLDNLKTWGEVAVFDSPENLNDVIDMLLSDEAKRLDIVEAGAKRVRENYLYEHVMKRAFERFGLK